MGLKYRQANSVPEQRERRPWHQLCVTATGETAPPDVDLEAELQLVAGLRRIDLAIRRRPGAKRDDSKARMLRPLWPLLGPLTFVEYKSPAHGYRRPDLPRLFSAAVNYTVGSFEQNGHYELPDLLLLLPRLGPALRDDAEFLRLSWQELHTGYFRLTGSLFAIYVVSTEEAAQAHDDDWLRLLAGQAPHTPETVAWYDNWLLYSQTRDPALATDEEFQRMRYKILETMSPEERLRGLTPEQMSAALAGLPPEQRLAGLPPEQRLAGLPPEQRLAGLSPEEQLLALPDEILRTLPLSDEYIKTLPVHVQEALRKRLATPTAEPASKPRG